MVLALLAAPALSSTGYRGYGLIGYGIDMYKPPCAHACRSSLSSYMLQCSEMEETEMDHGMKVKAKRMSGMDMEFTTSADCYATDNMFLQSLAYCIHARCSAVLISKLELFWETFVAGRQPGQPQPKISYTEALLLVRDPPAAIADAEAVLNTTTLTDDQAYLANYNGNFYFENMEVNHNTYGLVLLITGAAIPITLSLLRFVPWPKGLIAKFNSIILEPPLFGRRHRTPVRGLLLVPTRGQALFILYIIGINVVLCSVGYKAARPDSWFSSEAEAIAMYIANRTGVLSLANLPLLVLYSSRNNVLIWVTDWSHTTFLLIHRWVAIICTVQACLHSAIYLQSYDVLGNHAAQASLPYWIWGIIATLSLTILLPASILPFRQKLYEVFLASHLVLAFLAMIGCYFHIYYRFENQWGYETWVYMAFAIWLFDRLMRYLRVAKNGIRTAKIAIVDEDYLKIDIPGVVAHGHCYVYFPTLTWSILQNHPFSVMSTMVPTGPPRDGYSSSDRNSSQSRTGNFDAEKNPVRQYVEPPWDVASERDSRAVEPCVTFYLRTGSGLTSLLRSKQSLPILVEASYGRSLLYDDTIATPNTILIAGGVGITAIVPHLRRSLGRVRLFWGVRNKALADSVKDSLGPTVLEPQNVGEIAIGRRLDLRGILEKGVIGETTVVVCGPHAMADEVRGIVCELGRQRSEPIHLVDESFSW
ncbi:putative ferric-chelate reductase [Thozetella sp. PMI_491]|nr:putative ferric-chelate reductase [Thozetella sp. PMI_491]